jgi:hypothetical protein
MAGGLSEGDIIIIVIIIIIITIDIIVIVEGSMTSSSGPLCAPRGWSGRRRFRRCADENTAFFAFATLPRPTPSSFRLILMLPTSHHYHDCHHHHHHHHIPPL